MICEFTNSDTGGLIHIDGSKVISAETNAGRNAVTLRLSNGNMIHVNGSLNEVSGKLWQTYGSSDPRATPTDAPTEVPEAAQVNMTDVTGPGILTCSRADCRRRLNWDYGDNEDQYPHRCAACDQVFCDQHIAPSDHKCTAAGREAESEVARRMREAHEAAGGGAEE